MRRLGRNLKMTKNSATPRAKEVNSRLPHHARQRALHLRERPVGAAARGGGEQPGEQLVQLDLLGRDLMLHEVSDGGEQQSDEGDDGQQQIERQRAGEEGNVVFESRLERPTGDAGHRPMPAALGLHAPGSSSSSRRAPPRLAPRRRLFASVSRRSIATRAVGPSSSSSSAVPSSPPSSPAFSAARSRNPRSLCDSLVREASPGSGANRNPSTAPRPRPSRKGPNAAPRSLILPPPDHPAPPPPLGAAARVTAAAAGRSGRSPRASQ